MAVSFLAPNRTVLTISEEALYVYAQTSRSTRLIEVVPWEAENFEDNVASIVTKDCGGKPVVILNDMVEQHYRKERVIKTGVGIMDRANMLKRKLNIAFPNYPVRAALPLREKTQKKETKLAADIYIFAAVPDSKQFQKTIGAANSVKASIAGFCLLPVESSDMVKTLSARLTPEGAKPSKWVLFIGQHRSGGLRQIVTKNGELALTRMTSIGGDDGNADLWASDVLQEFRATMSYLTRFGFQNEDGLDIILISNPTAGDVFGRMLEDGFNYRSMTVLEAANILKLPIGQQDDLHYADVLHAAWIGHKSKFILPMKASQIDRVVQPRRAAIAASFVLFCSASFLGYQLMSEFQASAIINSDLSSARERLGQLNVSYQKEVEKKEALGFDVRLVQGSILVHQHLEKNNVRPLDLFSGVGRALGADLRVDKINVERLFAVAGPGLVKTIVGANEAQKKPPLFRSVMQMTYPSTTDIEKGNKEVSDLRGRMESFLPGHKVEVTKFLKDYEYSEQLVVETGDVNSKKNVAQDFVAEITVTGPEMP